MKCLLVNWNEIWLLLSIQWKKDEKTVADKNNCKVEGVENSSRRTLHIFSSKPVFHVLSSEPPLWSSLRVFFRIVRFRQKIHKHVSHHFVGEIRGSYIHYACKHGRTEGGGVHPNTFRSVKRGGGLWPFARTHASRRTLILEGPGFQQTQKGASHVGHRDIMLLGPLWRSI